MHHYISFKQGKVSQGDKLPGEVLTRWTAYSQIQYRARERTGDYVCLFGCHF